MEPAAVNAGGQEAQEFWAQEAKRILDSYDPERAGLHAELGHEGQPGSCVSCDIRVLLPLVGFVYGFGYADGWTASLDATEVSIRELVGHKRWDEVKARRAARVAEKSATKSDSETGASGG